MDYLVAKGLTDIIKVKAPRPLTRNSEQANHSAQTEQAQSSAEAEVPNQP